ncbi:O-antigen ligase family protein [Cytobacillus oceanisediminis]|uniref:O-antigen ligase family protein n=1 Tax=Cytobacillus oceanisediminis TaxID=665099 RepID=UPI001D132D07|nr:O-antigen ligase family protein [Cytobacillus oceanisediminis]MCC3648463.1 O-antigen ligase family protein [Cytobacillus oceanisediminis]
MSNYSWSHQIAPNTLNIKKSILEWFGIILLLLFSFLNNFTLLISLLLLLLLLLQREIGAIKIINIITLRTIINPGIAVSISEYQNLKWLILFGCSIYLLFSYFKLGKKEVKRIKGILILVSLFTVYNIAVALLFSSLPIIAIFKLMSYVVIFAGVLIGVGYTFNKFNWIKWMFNLFKLLMVISFFMISLPVSYLRNGYSFQGLTNHPNMFGIFSVLFIALLISFSNTSKESLNNKFFLIFSSSLVLFMVTLSKSRTALISCLILVLLYALFSNQGKISKIIIAVFSSIGFIFIFIGTNISNFIMEFLYKGQSQGENLLYSRMNQIESLTENFYRSPWFGNGFAVPVLPYRSFEFSSEFVVEPGNIILAVLSYSGIFGFLLFILYLVRIFWLNKKYFTIICFLPISTLLISMGEMVFFSSNNIGIWCYMFLAIYVFFIPERINLKIN